MPFHQQSRNKGSGSPASANESSTWVASGVDSSHFRRLLKARLGSRESELHVLFVVCDGVFPRGCPDLVEA